MKTCKTCKQQKELTEYNKNQLQKDGHDYICKDCRNEKKRSYNLVGGKKVCSKCRKTKELTEYCKKAYSKTGYNSQCKECAKLYQKSKRPEKPEVIHPEGEKECTGCKQSLPYPAFHRNKASKDMYMSKCKVCESDMAKARKAKEDINYAEFYYPVALD
jgi:hypothetical protein